MTEVVKMYRNKIRLNKPNHVQKLLARTANMLIDDEITEGKARAIGTCVRICSKVLRRLTFKNK